MTPLAANNSTRRWISALEASAYLGLTVGTVYSLLYSHKIPGARIGRTWRVDLKALDAQLEAGANGGKK